MHTLAEANVNLNGILSIISGIIFLIGFIPYGYDLVKGKTDASRVSWFVWACLDLVTAVGMYRKHALNGQIICAASGAWVIVGIVFKYCRGEWEILDYVCFASGLLGLVLWQIFNEPNIAIIAAMAGVFIASIPTFKIAWITPEKENKLSWTLFSISSLFALAAIPEWTIKDAAQPIVYAVIELIVMLLLFVKP